MSAFICCLLSPLSHGNHDSSKHGIMDRIAELEETKSVIKHSMLQNWLLSGRESAFERKRNIYVGRTFPWGCYSMGPPICHFREASGPSQKTQAWQSRCQQLWSSSLPPIQSWAVSESLWVSVHPVLQIKSTWCWLEMCRDVHRPLAV